MSETFVNSEFSQEHFSITISGVETYARRRSNEQNGLRAEWVQEQKNRKKLTFIN